MRAPPSPILTPLRLARLFRWAWLWLVKYALYLIEGGERAEAHLRAMKHAVGCLILLRAAAMTPARARRRLLHPPSAPRGFRKRRCQSRGRMLRAALGSHLRRRLRARGRAQRVLALLSALWNSEALAARLSGRLTRRLTRLCPLLPIRPPADRLTLRPCVAPAGADTS
jgi:hypothetical protein